MGWELPSVSRLREMMCTCTYGSRGPLGRGAAYYIGHRSGRARYAMLILSLLTVWASGILSALLLIVIVLIWGFVSFLMLSSWIVRGAWRCLKGLVLPRRPPTRMELLAKLVEYPNRMD